MVCGVNHEQNQGNRGCMWLCLSAFTLSKHQRAVLSCDFGEAEVTQVHGHMRGFRDYVPACPKIKTI